MEARDPNRARPATEPEYERPEVEQVMSADEIAREVHYAGTQPVSDFTGEPQ